MRFVFPDSGREIEIERISFYSLGLLRAHYEQDYRDKPVAPLDPLNDANYDSESEAWKAKNAQYLKDVKVYEDAFAVWEVAMNTARWAAQKVLYADNLAELDEASKAAVAKAIRQMQMTSGVDLPDEIVKTYKEMGVPFDVALLDKYIYLWHVCMTTTGDQALFQDWMQSGSQPTQEAVAKMLFRVQR